MTVPTKDLSFSHEWEAEILKTRPAILPARHYVFPQDAEEIDRGALEVLIRPIPSNGAPFLATCALGFLDPAVPSGIWSTPDPREICSVSGGYVYVIDTTAPERFSMLPLRPALQVVVAKDSSLLLFVGHHSILAWGPEGEAWRSARLSDEGVTVRHILGNIMHGTGWDMILDRETEFMLDLRQGNRIDP